MYQSYGRYFGGQFRKQPSQKIFCLAGMSVCVVVVGRARGGLRETKLRS